jgi:3-deoxy-7-phosphoheptulonate synthase
VSTSGNEDCHVILRGGKEPNYDAASVDKCCQDIAASGLAARVMVDFSHANSSKKYERQIEVAKDVAGQIAGGDERIVGVMVESHLVAGRQDLSPDTPLEYGKSVTDACINWEDTLGVLETLAQGVRQRRLVEASE